MELDNKVVSGQYGRRGHEAKFGGKQYCIEGKYYTMRELGEVVGCRYTQIKNKMQRARKQDKPITIALLKAI